MHIQINNKHALEAFLLDQNPRTDSKIIKDAKSAAEIGKGMVGASSEVTGQAMAQGKPGREHSSTDSEPGALNQRRCGGQTNSALRLPIQAVSSEGFVVRPLMHEFKPATGCRKGLMELINPRQPLLPQATVQFSEFRHRETMTTRQRGTVGLVVYEGKQQDLGQTNNKSINRKFSTKTDS
tara:strand:- start:46 stop:588 length:543 start_codon:yes stop_codon:yes gene_type:complete